MRLFHLVEAHLAASKGGVYTTGCCKGQFCLIDVIETALLKDGFVVGSNPAVTLFSDFPFEFLDNILREPVFAVVISRRWLSVCESFDEQVQLFGKTVMLVLVPPGLVVPGKFPVTMNVTERTKDAMVK